MTDSTVLDDLLCMRSHWSFVGLRNFRCTGIDVSIWEAIDTLLRLDVSSDPCRFPVYRPLSFSGV